jgi:ferritin-like metal-binding protein YciE
MGQNEIARILQETLDEEKEADQLLTELAVSGINIGAESEPEE